ncbi:MAG: hypothetical protein WAP51_03260 [Candidatus Sungiibacteriota bacterium]
MARYVVMHRTGSKCVYWDSYDCLTNRPTVAEILEAAAKEFPDIPHDQLEIHPEGYDAEILVLIKKKTS